MTRPSRRFAVVILATMALAAERAAAEVLWSWEFGSESGTFVTDGTFADTAGVFVFTFESFRVSASTIPGNVGATYVDNQAVSTMSWNGTVPTQFARANGTLTNGSNFDRSDGAYAECSLWQRRNGHLVSGERRGCPVSGARI